MTAQLTVVMYHYVRDLPRTSFPRLKGLLTSDFRRQVARLHEQYEMATLESSLAFLRGDYQPTRDLCLLTFDDGLKEHFAEVLPVLDERKIEGLFFIITSCLEERSVAPVHKNHFLMATLTFDEYRRAFLERLRELSPTAAATAIDEPQVARTYRWDEPHVAAFKYLLNFIVEPRVRDQILNDLFATYLGDEKEFAEELYLSWTEAREMQRAGMMLGGHSHSHAALATLDEPAQRDDLERCRRIIDERLMPQTLLPFSYPYGKRVTAFNDSTIEDVRRLGFDCAFATEVGANHTGGDLFAIRRVDTKDCGA
ncbi:MAG: polysaccharide deacetylase family protein [Pyrinomonadaceae bacterium MAG19_C2-C3]|nr:polysaccharide deacetylase family protein [Pyrinomonadaceae bacterium MAG19_C2-C3]